MCSPESSAFSCTDPSKLQRNANHSDPVATALLFSPIPAHLLALVVIWKWPFQKRCQWRRWTFRKGIGVSWSKAVIQISWTQSNLLWGTFPSNSPHRYNMQVQFVTNRCMLLGRETHQIQWVLHTSKWVCTWAATWKKASDIYSIKQVLYLFSVCWLHFSFLCFSKHR